MSDYPDGYFKTSGGQPLDFKTEYPDLYAKAFTDSTLFQFDLPDYLATTQTVPENQKPMPIHSLVISNEDFKKNMAIDVSEYVKKLQGNDYIPWGVSLHYLREYNPNLAVGFETNADGHPYFFDNERGGYLLAYIYDKKSGNTTPSIFFPIRNNKRQASAEVMMDNIGNQYQRAVAKVIAQETGIGWSLYSRIDESMLELEENEAANPQHYNPNAKRTVPKPAPAVARGGFKF